MRRPRARHIHRRRVLRLLLRSACMPSISARINRRRWCSRARARAAAPRPPTRRQRQPRHRAGERASRACRRVVLRTPEAVAERRVTWDLAARELRGFERPESEPTRCANGARRRRLGVYPAMLCGGATRGGSSAQTNSRPSASVCWRRRGDIRAQSSGQYRATTPTLRRLRVREPRPRARRHRLRRPRRPTPPPAATTASRVVVVRRRRRVAAAAESAAAQTLHGRAAEHGGGDELRPRGGARRPGAGREAAGWRGR